jgi:divalent metal cation (Fe/Co/Zn/Cd) transporter
VGYQVTSQMLHHLMDGVDADVVNAARKAAQSAAGLEDVEVRGRWMGRSLVLDVEATLGSSVSLGEADEIGARVQTAVYQAVPSARAVHWRPASRASTF